MKSAILFFAIALSCFAQSDPSAVPHLIKYAGSATAGTDTLTFAIYAAQDSTAPLWSETQTVTADDKGHYSVLLGSTTANGLPSSIFESGDARWLGVTNGSQPESARILLVSVPYALKAGDAQTLGGKPLSAFVMADASTAPTTSATSIKSQRLSAPAGGSGGLAISVDNGPGGTTSFLPKWQDASTLTNSIVFDSGTKVGIGTSTPNEQLEITGNLRLPATNGSTAGIIFAGPNRLLHTAPNGSGNLFVGTNAGNLTNTGTANLGIGNLALTSLTTGSANMAFGPSALANNLVGLQNTAIGTQALFNTTANNNTGIGFNSLVATTNGGGNVGVGTVAGQSNSTGTFNTFIGYNSDAGAGTLTNATAIGANARVNVSNAVILGNNANVGIGTSGPVVTGGGGLNIFNSAVAGIRLQTTGGTHEFLSINNGSFGLFDAQNAAYRIYIMNNGAVGIGTTTPTTTLDVNGTVRAAGGFRFADGSNTDTRYVAIAPTGVVYSNASLSGTYALSFLGITPVSSTLIRVFSGIGTVTFDAAGHATAGTLSLFTSGGACSATVGGTYAVNANGTGTANLTFTVTTGTCTTATTPFTVLVTQQGSSFEFAQNDNASWTSGQGHRQ